MFLGPTELLWIGCLIELIWIPKSKSNTSTPKTNSQTCWLKGISHVMSGTIFFICSISAISAPTCCAENSSLITCRKTMAKGMQEQKREDISVAKSKSTAMNLSSHVPTSSSSAKSPIASESPGMPIASGAERSQVITLKEKAWCPVHLKVWTSQAQGNRLHCLHIRAGWIKSRFPREREQNVDVSGCNESIFRFSNPVNVARCRLDGNRDQLLTQARAELMKQHKVESLNNCINELHQHAYAQRLELEGAHHGYVESRREKVRLQEELSIKEKALRETQIRNIHEMGEMKRPQELRVDDVSVHK